MSSKTGITLGKLAEELNAKLNGDANKIILGPNTLLQANKDEISFLSRNSYLKDLEKTNAAAVLISEDQASLATCNTIVGKDPYLLYAKATQIFKKLEEMKENKGISELVDISSSARISSSANIGSFSQIGEDVEIGEDVSIGSGVVICNSSKIGNQTRIYSNSSIYHSVSIGSNCIIHSGAVIGSDGFGFAREKENWEKKYLIFIFKIPK